MNSTLIKDPTTGKCILLNVAWNPPSGIDPCAVSFYMMYFDGNNLFNETNINGNLLNLKSYPVHDCISVVTIRAVTVCKQVVQNSTRNIVTYNIPASGQSRELWHWCTNYLILVMSHWLTNVAISLLYSLRSNSTSSGCFHILLCDNDIFGDTNLLHYRPCCTVSRYRKAARGFY